MAALLAIAVAVPAGCGSGRTRPAERDGGGDGSGSGTTCSSAADALSALQPQRTLVLTADQIVKAVRRLFGPEAAARVLSGGMVKPIPDVNRYFPPTAGRETAIDDTAFSIRDSIGQTVGEYVRDNFSAVTECATPTEACALAYLNGLASKAYRRDLTAEEQDAFAALFARLRSETVGGFTVSATVEEATQHAVYALLISPQFLWRYETGAATADSGTAGTPAAARLTDDELASAVSFFLTDEPPDDALRAAARARTLRTDLDRHVARILEQPAARDWLRSAMEIRFWLNQLPDLNLDYARWAVDPALVASLQTSTRMFLDEVLWRGQLSDLLTSRVAFLDPRLASEIYAVPPAPDALPGVFAKTLLPADQRSGLLTDAGFLTNLGDYEGVSLYRRALRVATLLTCTSPPPREDDFPAVRPLEYEQYRELSRLTASEQVAGRRRAECAECHETVDPIGLVLDAYDGVGRFRTVGDLGGPVETTVTLPGSIGSGTVSGAAEMADALAKSPAFVECMAAATLQLAAPGSPARVGDCAVADVTAKFKQGDVQSFGALVRAATASPAFTDRLVVP